jgi:hypothetical protein
LSGNFVSIAVESLLRRQFDKPVRTGGDQYNGQDEIDQYQIETPDGRLVGSRNRFGLITGRPVRSNENYGMFVSCGDGPRAR